MGTTHDSRILSEWLPMGASRAKMETFRARLQEALRNMGSFDAHAHRGRRDSASCDYVSVTSPGGWIAGHDGSATIKVRGCSNFRRQARALAPAIASSMGLTFNGIDPRGEYVGTKRAGS